MKEQKRRKIALTAAGKGTETKRERKVCVGGGGGKVL